MDNNRDYNDAYLPRGQRGEGWEVNPKGRNPVDRVGVNPVDDNPVGDNLVGANPLGDNPVGGNPVGGNSVGGNPVDGNTVDGDPVDANVEDARLTRQGRTGLTDEELRGALRDNPELRRTHDHFCSSLCPKGCPLGKKD